MLSKLSSFLRSKCNLQSNTASWRISLALGRYFFAPVSPSTLRNQPVSGQYFLNVYWLLYIGRKRTENMCSLVF